MAVPEDHAVTKAALWWVVVLVRSTYSVFRNYRISGTEYLSRRLVLQLPDMACMAKMPSAAAPVLTIHYLWYLMHVQYSVQHLLRNVVPFLWGAGGLVQLQLWWDCRQLSGCPGELSGRHVRLTFHDPGCLFDKHPKEIHVFSNSTTATCF